MTFASPFARRLVLCACCAGLAASWTARADSLVSSASSAGSASVGSLSDSLRASSNSSRRDDDRNALVGDWRIVAVEEAPRPDAQAEPRLRLALQPLAGAAVARPADDGPLYVDLPPAALGTPALARGDTIAVLARPYGLELARNDRHEAFFLLLAEDWAREMPARAVVAPR